MNNTPPRVRGGRDLERLYLLDDPAFGVQRTDLGDELITRSLQRYRIAARHVRSGDRVLDCACGSGYGAAILKNARAAYVLGIDLDPVTIEYATRHYGSDHIEFRCLDLRQIDIPPASFDTVVSIETIEHVFDPRSLAMALCELLVPGGRAVISTPIAERSGPNPNNPYHLHEFTIEDFMAMMRSVFDSTEFYQPSAEEMPLRLTDGQTLGIVFGIGRKRLQ